MEWKMEVYSPDLELLGILETYDALVVEQWAFEPGSFSLQSVLTPQTRDLLRPENILWLEGETAGIIEVVQASVSESGDILSVKGPLLDGILSRRILWGQYNLYGSPPALMYEVVRDCAISPTRGSAAQRTIPHLALAGEVPEDARRIRKQSTGDTLTDFLTEVGQANGVAHGVRFNPVVPQMEFWARLGVDRTVHQTAVDPVLYSTELDDVLSSEYAYDASRYRNVALVAGEGEGELRKTKEVYKPEQHGILPAGYSHVEFIEFSGNQYINTGILLTSRHRIVADFQLLETNNIPAIFGARWNNYTEGFMLYLYNQSFYVGLFGTVSYYPNFPSVLDKIHIEFGGGILKLNGSILELKETEFTAPIPFFINGYNENGPLAGSCKVRVFSFSVFDGDSEIANYVPCIGTDGVTRFYDVINRIDVNHIGSGTLVPGSVIFDDAPFGITRRETYVDARDLQSNVEPDDPMTEEEYLEALKTRGKENLSDHQLVQSFSATVRTLDPTYVYGVDFFLGDTITVTDERLGLSVSALVEGVERSVGKNGEDLILTLGYGPPTLGDRLRKAGV